MGEEKTQDGQPAENEAVQQFLKLLMENQPGAGQDYSLMLWQIDRLENQLSAAMEELSEVKGQLAEMQESPVKSVISHAAEKVGKRLHAVQEGIADMKERIITGAKEAVAGVKQMGVKALDQAVAAIDIKETLENMQKNLSASLADVKQTITKVEAVGQELRSAGGHLKNAGRAAAGKELAEAGGGTEGRFQSAVLAPLRMERSLLARMNNLTLAAIGNVERLEQAAGKFPEEKQADTAKGKQEEKQKEADGMEELEPPPDKPARSKEKQSVLKDLQEKKAQAASRPAPAPDKGRKKQEAAL